MLFRSVTVLATEVPSSACRAAGVVTHNRGHYWLGSDRDGRIGLFDAVYVRFPNSTTLPTTTSDSGLTDSGGATASSTSLTLSNATSSPLVASSAGSAQASITLSSSPQPTPSQQPPGQGYNAIVNHYLPLVDLLSSDMDLALAFVNNPNKEMTEQTAK